MLYLPDSNLDSEEEFQLRKARDFYRALTRRTSASSDADVYRELNDPKEKALWKYNMNLILNYIIEESAQDRVSMAKLFDLEIIMGKNKHGYETV